MLSKIKWLRLTGPFLFLILSTSLASAQNTKNTLNQVDIEHLIALAAQKNLAQSPQWLALLHYNKGGTLRSRNKSYIDDPKFFLAENGKSSPGDELIASIKALFFTKSDTRCKYIARYHWLSEQLRTQTQIEGIQHCTQFLQVKNSIPADRLVLVFPSSYLNSPSSIFGHTLLRVDPDEKTEDAALLNWAINFGAMFGENDNPFQYFTRGLSGGYKGQYFIVPYAQKLKEYGQMENRDIWEYRLDLSKSEVAFILAHLWELKEINFDYYFFDENCSYRLLQLIEVARPSLELSTQVRLTEVPLNTVKTFHQAGLIKETNFRPSKQRELAFEFSRLSKDEKDIALTLTYDPEALKRNAFKNLDPEKQYEVLHAAYANLRFQQNQKRRNDKLAAHSLFLLKTISKIDSKNKKVKTPLPQPELATNAHDSHRLSVGGGQLRTNSETDGNSRSNFTSLSYRMSYHDLLDNQKAYFAGAHVEALSVKINYYSNNNDNSSHNSNDGQLKVDQFKLAEINSIGARSSFRKPISWRASLRAERSIYNNRHLSTIIEGGPGLSWQFKNLQFYQFVNPRLELNPNFLATASSQSTIEHARNYEIGLMSLSGLLQYDRWGVGQVSYEALKLSNLEARKTLSIKKNINLSKNQALRLKASELNQSGSKTKLISLNYLYYF